MQVLYQALPANSGPTRYVKSRLPSAESAHVLYIYNKSVRDPHSIRGFQVMRHMGVMQTFKTVRVINRQRLSQMARETSPQQRTEPHKGIQKSLQNHFSGRHRTPICIGAPCAVACFILCFLACRIASGGASVVTFFGRHCSIVGR